MDSSYRFSNFSIDALISPRTLSLSPFLNLNPWLFPSGHSSLPPYGLVPPHLHHHHPHAAAAAAAALGIIPSPEDLTLNRFSASDSVCSNSNNNNNNEQVLAKGQRQLSNNNNYSNDIGFPSDILVSKQAKHVHTIHRHRLTAESPPTTPGHSNGRSNSFTDESPTPLTGQFTFANPIIIFPHALF